MINLGSILWKDKLPKANLAVKQGKNFIFIGSELVFGKTKC